MTERFYGGDGTIHQNGEVNVELHNGKVVAVWFRCTMLPFTQSDVDSARAKEMSSTRPAPLTGVIQFDEFDR